MTSSSIIRNFSISGIYEYYSGRGPGMKTGFIHRTMYFPHQDQDEIARLISQHERFVVLIQQNEYAVSLFQRDIQPQLHAANKPYVIITGMDDFTFPYEVVGSFFITSSSSSLFRGWFATNCLDRFLLPDKITPIPYGIDYWTLSARKWWTNTPMASAYTQDRHLSRLRASAVHFSKRHTSSDGPPRIYINFQFNMLHNVNNVIRVSNKVNIVDTVKYTNYERLEALFTIPNDLVYIQETPVNRYDTWGAYTQHVFVASPRGNGLDTIRTWEALMLGCIVIVRRIPGGGEGACVLEELYRDLPVVIIDHWFSITRDFLDQILSEYSQRTFRYDKLEMSYWLDQIEAAFNAE
jgi:hypothetical protein